MIVSTRHNSFDLLRLFLAVLVVLSHCYLITGVQEKKPLYVWSGGLITMGTFAVNGFFVISGYLVYGSLQRSFSVLHFLWKRVLRIFPALFGLALFSILITAFIYDGSQRLVENKSFWIYPLKVI